MDQSARNLLDFLHRNQRDGLIEYPHSFSYPANCCESVSLILTYLLEKKFQIDNVKIIKGTNRQHQHHFWVLVGDLIYDLTIHQFPGQKPIVGALADRFLLDTFPDWEIETARDYICRQRIEDLFRRGFIPF